MTQPRLLPMMRPFAEAVAYQRERVPMTRETFDALSSEAKLRAFTIAGLTRRGLVAEAYQLAHESLAKNQTKSEFMAQLGELLDKQEGLILDARRIDLIAQNNTAISYASGRHAQLRDPKLLAIRPYWQYPTGPDDARTSAICRSLQGLVARHDDPIWKHIFPPNHHGERHYNVRSLTPEQAAAAGTYESAGEKEYPFVDGREILPDPGFDYSPELLAADDRALVEAARAVGDALPAKRPEDYGLLPFADIVATQPLPDAPALGERINPARLGDADQYEAAWERFRAAVGFAVGAETAAVVDYAADTVLFTRATFDHMVGLDAGTPEARLKKHDRPAFFPLIRPTLEDPMEVWMVPHLDAQGRVSWTRRYFGAFRKADGEPRSYQVFVEQSPQGWAMESGFSVKASRLEANRRGLLVYRRSGRSV